MVIRDERWRERGMQRRTFRLLKLKCKLSLISGFTNVCKVVVLCVKVEMVGHL